MDVNSESSSKTGLAGFFEVFLRKFRVFFHMILMLPLYGVGSICMGVALVPGIYLVRWTLSFSYPFEFLKWLCLGMALGGSFFLFGFGLLLIAPIVNFVLRARLQPWRGPYYSLEAVSWYIHNATTYLVRFIFLEFITPTPYSLMFFRLMGMKIGKGTVINTSFISDPSLITLGEHVTIGGSVTLVGHYGQGGFLVLSPVKIGNNVTVGLKATVFGGVTIGDGAKILPHSVLLPNTVVPAGETWGGVPAVRLELKKAA